jgi:hypothetical protein
MTSIPFLSILAIAIHAANSSYQRSGTASLLKRNPGLLAQTQMQYLRVDVFRANVGADEGAEE